MVEALVAQVVLVALVVLVARMAAETVVEALVALAALVAALVVRVKARSVHMPCTPHTRVGPLRCPGTRSTLRIPEELCCSRQVPLVVLKA